MSDFEQISKLFYDLLVASGVKRVPETNAYVVFNNDGVLFSINYKKTQDEYEIERTSLIMKEYAKRGINPQHVPSLSMVYNWVEFQHAVYQLFSKNDKNIEHIFHNLIPYTDVDVQQKGDFETYVVYGQGQKLYQIGYNEKTKQHGFKRFEPMQSLYYAMSIPLTIKPDYEKLYRNVKNMHLAQVVMENIQHLYIQ